VHYACCARPTPRSRLLPGGTPDLHSPHTPAPQEKHRHSGIGLHTPASVHYGSAKAVREQRAVVLSAAYAAHPERFVNKAPTPPELPGVAWINKPQPTEDAPKIS